MKIYIQAKPQLRGPQGFHQWYAQLPVAEQAGDEPEGTLPIGCLLRQNSSVAAPAASAFEAENSGGLPLMSLFSLFSKKLYYKYAGLSRQPVAGPWLRHLLG